MSGERSQSLLTSAAMVHGFSPPGARRRRAFTRIELCASLAALTLLLMVALPALAANRSGSERAVCFNNLRMIGRAIHSWAGDYQGRVPWRVPVSEGGTRPDSGTKPGASWYEYALSLTNELVTPKILKCPSDAFAPVVARDWVQFISPAFRNNATSYSLGMDVFPETPRDWVGTDRNVKFDTSSSGNCSARVNGFYGINSFPGTSLASWTNAVHGTNAGHLLFNDGSVLFSSSQDLRDLPRHDGDNGTFHFAR